MNILGFNIRTNKKVEEEQQEFRSMFDYYDKMLYDQYNYNPYSGSYSSPFVLDNHSLKLSACYRAVNLISDSIASLQMKIYNKDESNYKTEAIDDPIYNLLAYEPNPYMSKFDFFKMIVTSLHLRGNAYIKINRNKKEFTKIESLDLINPDDVSPFKGGNGDIKYKIVGYSGVINSADMIHIRNFPEFGNIEGRSTLSYAADSLAISHYSENHAQKFFENGASSASYLTHDNMLQPEQKALIIKGLKEQSSGTKTNGISLVGGLINPKFNSLGISPKDSQLLETRLFGINEIGRFFSINPILLFDNTKGTYNNIEFAQLDFYNTTLLPMIEKLESAFTNRLILPIDRKTTEIRFDVENMFRADMNSRADYYTKMIANGVYTPNQVANILNLPRIKGEGGDKNFISTNLQDINNLIVNTTNSVDNKLLSQYAPNPNLNPNSYNNSNKNNNMK